MWKQSLMRARGHLCLNIFPLTQLSSNSYCLAWVHRKQPQMIPFMIPCYKHFKLALCQIKM